MKFMVYFALLAFVICPIPCEARTFHVPTEVASITGAVLEAVSGDTIMVASGTYFENIDTGTKFLSLIGSEGMNTTIIDGSSVNTVVRFGGGGLLEGFTIQHGKSANDGGGIELSGSFTINTIRYCRILENIQEIGNGGGIHLDYRIIDALIEYIQ